MPPIPWVPTVEARRNIAARESTQPLPSVRALSFSFNPSERVKLSAKHRQSNERRGQRGQS